MALLASPYGKAYFSAHARRTTGIATINRKILSEFTLFAPSLPIQERIAARVEEETAGAKKIRQNLQGQLRAVDELPKAILYEAFSGAL